MLFSSTVPKVRKYNSARKLEFARVPKASSDISNGTLFEILKI